MPKSAMYMLLDVSKKTLVGELIKALVAVLVSPVLPQEIAVTAPLYPAIVVMIPEGSTRRIRQLLVSAMYNTPLLSNATPDG